MSEEKETMYGLIGVAVIILAFCLGPSGCKYINAKTKLVEAQTQIQMEKKP